MQSPDSSILALDVGQARIGVALATSVARLASPLTTLPNNDDFLDSLRKLVAEHAVSVLVVGLPRGLDGQETGQTSYVREFAATLDTLGLPVHLQDEALTSAHAEQELRNRGVAYTKEDVDSLSATYILEDYLQGEHA